MIRSLDLSRFTGWMMSLPVGNPTASISCVTSHLEQHPPAIEHGVQYVECRFRVDDFLVEAGDFAPLPCCSKLQKTLKAHNVRCTYTYTYTYTIPIQPIHMYIYIYMYIYIHTSTSTFTCIYTYTYTYTFTYTYTDADADAYVYTHPYAYACACIYM